MEQGSMIKTNLQRFKEQCEEMRRSVLPYENRTETHHVSNDTPKMNEIGGISLGKLDTYRKGYRERKLIHGEKAEIKVPRELSIQFETDPLLKKKYIDFITSE
jgi:hypothetical protein